MARGIKIPLIRYSFERRERESEREGGKEGGDERDGGKD